VSIVVGHCPGCGEVMILAAAGGRWPLAECPCGWAGSIGALKNQAAYRPGFHYEPPEGQ
jgi:hypothetical protein